MYKFILLSCVLALLATTVRGVTLEEAYSIIEETELTILNNVISRLGNVELNAMGQAKGIWQRACVAEAYTKGVEQLKLNAGSYEAQLRQVYANKSVSELGTISYADIATTVRTRIAHQLDFPYNLAAQKMKSC